MARQSASPIRVSCWPGGKTQAGTMMRWARSPFVHDFTSGARFACTCPSQVGTGVPTYTLQMLLTSCRLVCQAHVPPHEHCLHFSAISQETSKGELTEIFITRVGEWGRLLLARPFSLAGNATFLRKHSKGSGSSCLTNPTKVSSKWRALSIF